MLILALLQQQRQAIRILLATARGETRAQSHHLAPEGDNKSTHSGSSAYAASAPLPASNSSVSIAHAVAERPVMAGIARKHLGEVSKSATIHLLLELSSEPDALRLRLRFLCVFFL